MGGVACLPGAGGQWRESGKGFAGKWSETFSTALR